MKHKLSDRKIIYLINPISGTRGKNSLRKLVELKTKQANIDFDIIPTETEGNYELLRSKIEKENITDIVVCGGDGTIRAVAAALIGVNVQIGIIPMGSGNGLALTAKIPLVASKAIDTVLNGKASWIDGFYINREFSCMLCGLGFDARVAHDFAKQKRRGLQTYIKVSLINLFSAKPYEFGISTVEKSFNTEAFFISIANSNQFGNNFTIAPEASLKDGLLDIVIVKKMNKLVLPFSIIRQVTGINGRQELGDYVKRKNIMYFQTASLTIENKHHAPLHIDGDPKATAGTFQIRLVRHALNLIQPV
jgi:diacylglycerol kinase (ATP)